LVEVFGVENLGGNLAQGEEPACPITALDQPIGEQQQANAIRFT
jgi:hypothetical protein